MDALRWILIGLVVLGLVLALVGKGDLPFTVAVAVTLILMLAGVV